MRNKQWKPKVTVWIGESFPEHQTSFDVFIKRRVYGIFQKMLPYSVDIGTVYQMWFG